mmetsp:Transcript_127478/g.271820  ORF Transcript_127478/g.271820 Transcript_127478/m.271820 type:complete len:98 (+) Transcript_127478:476-769(+)
MCRNLMSLLKVMRRSGRMSCLSLGKVKRRSCRTLNLCRMILKLSDGISDTVCLLCYLLLFCGSARRLPDKIGYISNDPAEYETDHQRRKRGTEPPHR